MVNATGNNVGPDMSGIVCILLCFLTSHSFDFQG